MTQVVEANTRHARRFRYDPSEPKRYDARVERLAERIGENPAGLVAPETDLQQLLSLPGTPSAKRVDNKVRDRDGPRRPRRLRRLRAQFALHTFQTATNNDSA